MNKNTEGATQVEIDNLSTLDLYHLFRIRDALVTVEEYGLLDMNSQRLLDEVKRVIETKV